MLVLFYCITVGVFLIFLGVLNARRHLETIGRRLYRLLLWISHPGPLNLLPLTCQLLFVLLITYITFFDGLFRPISAKSSRERSGKIALINLMLLTASPSQNVIPLLLGLRRRTFGRIHACLGFSTILLMIFHGWLSVVVQGSFPLHVANNVWGLIAGVALLVTALFTRLRKNSYEVFTYIHPLVALLLVVALGRHMMPNLYFYFLVASFPASSVAQLGWLLYLNLPCWTSRQGASTGDIDETNGPVLKEGEATVANLRDAVQGKILEDEEKHLTRHCICIKHDLIEVRLKLPRAMHIKEGQFLSICAPSTRLCRRPFFQVHPFSVASWSAGQATSVELLIEPRDGWTKDLLRYTQSGKSSRLPILVAGPYGTRIPTDIYEVVILVASGFGIIAHLPYIKKITYEYNSCRSCTRRIHLVWQLKTPDLLYLFLEKLNIDIKSSILLRPTVFIESGFTRELPLQINSQMIIHKGLADIGKVIEEKVSEDITGRQEAGKALILISAIESMREKVRQTSRRYLDEGVTLSELEYQPETSA